MVKKFYRLVILKLKKKKKNIYRNMTPIFLKDVDIEKALVSKKITKKKYYSEKISKYKHDTKKTWNITKELIGKIKLK